MSYPYQIKSYKQYQEVYKKSIEHPETFGQKLLNILFGKKNGIKCWNGILQNLKWNGLKEPN